MQIHKLDHVNLRTTRLDEMVTWYRDILGLPTGDRPDFPFDGAWIYVGETATVHLIVIANEAENAASLKLEHFAFSATGIAEFVELLKGRGIAHSLDPVPGFPVVQVNLHDPDGNHIHVDFPAEEAAQMV